MSTNPDQTFTFGRFRLQPSQKLLTEDGRPVRIGSRAFDLLVALVQRTGEVLERNELVRRVWPDSVVEDGSLRAHIAALRRMLGEGRDGARFISNIAGRGYCFVADVHVEFAPMPTETGSAHPVHPTNLPVLLTRMVGRDDVLVTLTERARRERLVSIVGPGGVGKTTLALAVGEALLSQFRDGVWLVDLSTIIDERKICSVLATALDAPAGAAESLRDLAAFLRNKKMMIVFDNCEHMLDAVAQVAHEILRDCPGMQVLATSREPLRIAGESVQRLRPLDLPAPDLVPSVSAALQSSAVQLFVERAIFSVDSFELTEANVSFVVELCCQLDGLPLAIELAAARVDAYGVRGLLIQMRDRVSLLSNARRGVAERHRTLGSMISWSYNRLSPSQQILLRRLAVFSGNFTVDAAIAVASHGTLDSETVFREVAGLASRSMLSTQQQGELFSYRMLFSTGAFARELFEKDEDHRTTLVLHARYLAGFLQKSEESASKLTRPEWMLVNGRVIDDVRAALAWAFSESGDVGCGIELASAAVSLGHGLSLYEEFRDYVEQAIARLPFASGIGTIVEMRLHAALAAFSLITLGPTAHMVYQFQKALTYVAGTGTAYEVEALNGLWIAMQTAGDHRASENSAQRIAVIAKVRDDPVLALTADRLLGSSEHFLGRHSQSHARIERHLSLAVHPRRHGPPFPLDPRISLRCYLARIHWLCGRPDDAAEVVSEALALAADEVSHAISLTLGWAGCPIAFWRGELELAHERTQWMYVHSSEHRLGNWRNWAQNFMVALQQRQRRARGERIEAAAPVQVGDADGLQRDVLRTLDASVQDVDTLARVRAGQVGWCGPEILRLHAVADFVPAQPESSARTLRALDEARRMARDQEALSWELRIAMDIARALAASGEIQHATDELSKVYDCFTQGFGTADLVAARGLLADLHKSGRR